MTPLPSHKDTSLRTLEMGKDNVIVIQTRGDSGGVDDLISGISGL